MFQLTDNNLIKQRIKHLVSDKQLRNDYKHYGSIGREIIKWI